MNTKFRRNRERWVEIPDGFVLLRGEDCVRKEDLCYTPAYGFLVADEDSVGMNISLLGFHAVIRKKADLHEKDGFFEDESLVEVFDEYIHGKSTGRTIFELADPDYAINDQKREEAEKINPKFSGFKIDVHFRQMPRADATDADLWESGFNTTAEEFEEGECFPVRRHYKAWYSILNPDGNNVVSGNLSEGLYRLHNGRVEKKRGLEWVKSKKAIRDEENQEH